MTSTVCLVVVCNRRLVYFF